MNTRPTQQSSGTLLALALCMGLQMTGFVLILPLFARRFETFGAGMEALGISAMAYALTSTIAAPFMGMLADRFGCRPIIVLSLAACALAFSGYLFATSALMLIALRGLAGLFTAGLSPSIISIVSDLAPESRRAQWIGIVNGGASAGWIVGPLMGGLLYDYFGYVIPFVVSIVMASSALLLAIFLLPESSIRPALVPSRSRWMPGFQALRASLPLFLPTFALLMLVSFGVMFAWAFIEPQFMFYVYDNLNWSSSQLGLVMSTYGVALMFGEFALGQLSDRLGRKPVLVLGLALFSAQFIGLVFFRDVAAIVVSFILAGLGNALYDPALSAHILDITCSERKAQVMGLKGTIGSLGNLLGPALVVLVMPFTGSQGIFLASAGLVLVLALISGLFLRAPNAQESTQYSS